VMVTRIDVHLTETAPGKTLVDVLYDQTALDSGASASVLERSRHGDAMAREWAEQLTTALR
jgi:hypothetical protein